MNKNYYNTLGINVLSLFDGISCGKIALDRAKIKINNYFASEINKYAINVSKNNHPNIIQLGDITKIKQSNLPKIDLITGGSPCQGFSNIGNLNNFKHNESELFFEYIRLINECKPRWFLLENVKMKKNFKNIISNFMKCEPIEINSCLVSAQNRPRLYWTNIKNINQPIDKGINLNDILENNINEKYYVINKYKDLLDNIDFKKYHEYNRKCNLTILIGNHSFQDKKLLTTYKTPTLSTRCTTDYLVLDKTFRFRRFTLKECERLQTLDDNYTNYVSYSQRECALGNCWTVDIIKHIFNYLKKEINNETI